MGLPKLFFPFFSLFFPSPPPSNLSKDWGGPILLAEGGRLGNRP